MSSSPGGRRRRSSSDGGPPTPDAGAAPSPSPPPTPGGGRPPGRRIPSTRPARTPSPRAPREKPKRPPIVRASSMPDIQPLSWETQRLIQEQLTRKKKLEIELDEHKERLSNMQRDAEELERELNARIQAPAHFTKVRELRDEIVYLRDEVSKLANEVTSLNTEVPLGETNIRFYRNMNMGQREPRANSSRHSERRRGEGEASQWCCHICTFRNHHLLDKCEACGMIRFPIDERETQNIHIQVTHRNYPSCKVVHSWVL